jgi:hypothetical protein
VRDFASQLQPMVELSVLSATSQAMMDALLRLVQDGSECCSFADIITTSYANRQLIRPDDEAFETASAAIHIETDDAVVASGSQIQEEPITGPNHVEEALPKAENLNPSQKAAIDSCEAPLALIWGPPGQLIII